ncbi:ribbon-helix-helix domain-containing protein [Hazenella sp. IB182357]|uniref:Ribbon-helix-helix domain-containing protein n=1 Tax=Polycladospora coralii TaxID=2771432 RepID=A0A926NC36_9BACL|nr:ribbon-helix-helix domain-containing protein [Polycladospora coralii]MBD1373837.1 ribbon-helix-helix domain-containing protein [Polycladospora coralii]
MSSYHRLKNRVPINNAIRTELKEALIDLSKETSISQSKLLDQAIELLLDKYDKPVPSKKFDEKQ